MHPIGRTYMIRGIQKEKKVNDPLPVQVGSTCCFVLLIMKSSLVLLLLCGTAVAIGIGRKQAAGVRGQLVCDGKPANGVKVKLYDDDRGIDTDDLLDQGKTDSQGHFELAGYTHEFTTIDPKLNIYHDCNDGLTPCQRKVTIFLPDKYVFSGEKPKDYYEAGTIELAGKFKGEERDCLN
uniref:Transthyretin-like family protein n=1 Tax=Panagrellus redivivus TaxID=6233 RepID=A0A7E4VAF8_PANRE